jgi:hypothetical protein
MTCRSEDNHVVPWVFDPLLLGTRTIENNTLLVRTHVHFLDNVGVEPMRAIEVAS